MLYVNLINLLVPAYLYRFPVQALKLRFLFIGKQLRIGKS